MSVHVSVHVSVGYMRGVGCVRGPLPNLHSPHQSIIASLPGVSAIDLTPICNTVSIQKRINAIFAKDRSLPSCRIPVPVPIFVMIIQHPRSERLAGAVAE